MLAGCAVKSPSVHLPQTKADKEEAERVQKLPEINKAERYIDEVMKVAFPQLQNGEIAEVLADFKNKIKLASDEAMSNLKNLR